MRKHLYRGFGCMGLLWLLLGQSLWGQSTLRLHLLPTDVSVEELAEEVDLPKKEYRDSVTIFGALTDLVTALREAAYWEANVDTLLYREGLFTAFLHRGPRYRWGELRPGNIPRAWLSKVGFRARSFRKEINPLAWEKLRDRLLREAGRRGYPFASIRLDSIVWEEEGSLSATMQLERGPKIQLSEVVIPEDAGISKRYLQNYLDLHPGQDYQQDRMAALGERIRELPYLQMQSPPLITFEGSEARVELPIQRRRASRFDFVIGVLPNSGQNRNLLITGQLDADLYNSLGRGERLAVSFEQLRPQTQQLELAVQYPYLLNLPFGLDLAFDLYRRDTNFVNLDQRIGVLYPLDGRRSVQVYYQWQRTNLLSVDSISLTRNGRLPDTLDVNRSSFGLAFHSHQLDYIYNPRRGTQFSIRGSAGTKRIRRNNRILGLGLENLYDSLSLRTAQYRLEMEAAFFLPLGANATLKTAIQGAAILSEEAIFANEQYRIGGNRLLRGFAEESIFATNYAVFTAEARYLLGQNSYAYLFGDLARVDASSQGSDTAINPVDYPVGIGAGITFETRAGLFGLSLALGKRRGLPFDPGKPTVHLGYVNRF